MGLAGTHRIYFSCFPGLLHSSFPTGDLPFLINSRDSVDICPSRPGIAEASAAPDQGMLSSWFMPTAYQQELRQECRSQPWMECENHGCQLGYGFTGGKVHRTPQKSNFATSPWQPVGPGCIICAVSKRVQSAVFL